MLSYKQAKVVVQGIGLDDIVCEYEIFEEKYPQGSESPIPEAAQRLANELTDNPNCKEVRVEIVAKKYSS